MIVLKFGGSSINSSQAIRNVADIIYSKRNRHPIVVLSACGDTTDNLLASIKAARDGEFETALASVDSIYTYHQSMAAELEIGSPWKEKFEEETGRFTAELRELLRGVSLLRDISRKSIDRIVSFGERFSTLLMMCHVNTQGIDAHLVESREFMKTTDEHTRAKPLLEESEPLIQSTFNLPEDDGNYSIPIAQGFIGSTLEGDISTLGRGGSDYTASIIGAALEAETIEIWSDVDGILTADPTIIDHARVIKEMTFREASELAYFGARVLHPDTILPAVELDIPIQIYNTRNPESDGSLIRRDFPDHQEQKVVKSIAYKEGIQVLNLTSTRMFQAHDFLRKVFEVLDRHQVVADLVSTSEVSVSIAFAKDVDPQPLIHEISKFSTVSMENRKAIVCLVGENMRAYKGLPGRIFKELENFHINMISQGASEVNLSFVIDEADIEPVVRTLHDAFFAEEEKYSQRTMVSG
ncbi:MAG: aspartate kinase [Candidatus Marinimicrobia bacterium]|nr:aspartate kinase [Candidatus Neomarinimicrobiota bacterium]MCF7828680.1 aspartate kinase [Candidatus Neomarinimicrobiota bacterium]MCF7880421.1 aspartate kinase [Candidatus Neomarinimicrobiota bacterium]